MPVARHRLRRGEMRAARRSERPSAPATLERRGRDRPRSIALGNAHRPLRELPEFGASQNSGQAKIRCNNAPPISLAQDRRKGSRGRCCTRPARAHPRFAQAPQTGSWARYPHKTAARPLRDRVDSRHPSRERDPPASGVNIRAITGWFGIVTLASSNGPNCSPSPNPCATKKVAIPVNCRTKSASTSAHREAGVPQRRLHDILRPTAASATSCPASDRKCQVRPAVDGASVRSRAKSLECSLAFDRTNPGDSAEKRNRQ